MNIHNKLRSIGFKKSPIMIRTYIPSKKNIKSYYKLVPADDLNPELVGGYWTHTYKYTFNKEISIYCNLRKESNIEIYLSENMICDFLESSTEVNGVITGIKDIYSLLPKQIRRKIIIESIISGK